MNLSELLNIFNSISKGLPVELSMFYRSFLFDHHWAYVSAVTDDKARVKFNFPLLPDVFKDHLQSLAKTESIPNILNYASAKGYIAEEQFFCSLTCSLNVYLSNGTDPINLQLEYIVKREFKVLTQLTVDTMYRLRNNHPFIDGVGVFHHRISMEDYLLFVQVSTSKYSHHDSKLNDLFADKTDIKGHKELKSSYLVSLFSSNGPVSDDSPSTSSSISHDAGTSTSMPLSYFDYYCGLATRAGYSLDRNHILYLYASNLDLDQSQIELMKKHAKERCSVGVLVNQSSLFCD